MSGTAEADDIKRDRYLRDHRCTYVAHGKKYVMVRYPHCIPIVVDEKEWRSLPIVEKPRT